ncbi:MAG: ATP synthase subunit I [Synechococcus sp.]
MTVDWPLIPVLLFGFLLGYFYFGILWLTVRQLPSTQWPVRLFVGSFLGRMALALLGMYWISDGQWTRIIVCLCGMVLARILLIHRLQPPSEKWRIEGSQHGN